MQPQPQPKYMTGNDLAARFHRSRRTIDRWVEENGFPRPAMTGKGVTSLWHTSDVEAWEEKFLNAPASAAESQ